MFDAVVLTDDEARAEIWGGLVISRLGERPPKAKQRCPHLDAASCGIYTERPSACRAYECRLYRAVSVGAVDIAEALERVVAMRSLIEAITGRLAGRPAPKAFVSRLKEAANQELEYPDSYNTVEGMLDAIERYRSEREQFLPGE